MMPNQNTPEILPEENNPELGLENTKPTLDNETGKKENHFKQEPSASLDVELGFFNSLVSTKEDEEKSDNIQEKINNIIQEAKQKHYYYPAKKEDDFESLINYFITHSWYLRESKCPNHIIINCINDSEYSVNRYPVSSNKPNESLNTFEDVKKMMEEKLEKKLEIPQETPSSHIEEIKSIACKGYLFFQLNWVETVIFLKNKHFTEEFINSLKCFDVFMETTDKNLVISKVNSIKNTNLTIPILNIALPICINEIPTNYLLPNQPTSTFFFSNCEKKFKINKTQITYIRINDNKLSKLIAEVLDSVKDANNFQIFSANTAQSMMSTPKPETHQTFSLGY